MNDGNLMSTGLYFLIVGIWVKQNWFRKLTKFGQNVLIKDGYDS
jgi:hypothetical protein